MEQKKSASSSKKAVAEEDQEKVIQWEDYEQELARLLSLSSAFKEANEKKLLLQNKLEVALQVEGESLCRSNELGEMREKLESRKLVMGNMSMHSKVLQDKVKKQEEQLSTEIRSLLVAGTALSVASKRLQDANKSLSGERGYGHLKKLQKMLKMRQRHMISQVSLLYPVKVVLGHAPEQELEAFTSTSRSANASGSKPLDQEGSLTILGLRLSMLPFTKTSFFTDKKEAQKSSIALGYVAHAVPLIAAYLEVPLRYPLRLGGSRSYICDHAPSSEHATSSDAASDPTTSSFKPIEFPLFLEGQDTTRAAYAVFLLNKDLEQILNFMGVKSLGPRHILANLKEILRTVLSPEYIDT
jgi:hypothetical protein